MAYTGTQPSPAVRRTHFFARAGLVASLLCLAPDVAYGQAADVLFDQGKKLLDEGKFDEACALLKKSDELDPAVGTKFHLADCYVKAGKSATGWKLFMEVAQISKTVGYEAGETAALQRAEELKGTLSRLTIAVAKGQSGITVRLNGEIVPKSDLGKGLPLDPGEYTVEAVAAEKQPFSATIDLAGSADAQTVEIPILEDLDGDAPAAAPTETPTTPEDTGPAQEEDGSTQRLIGYIVGGVGVVGLGVGTAFGLTAMSKWSERNDHCPNNRCDATAVDLADQTNTFAMLSNIGFGLGIVGLGVGGYLVFTAPSGPADSTAVTEGVMASASVDSRGASVTIRGNF